MPIDTQAFIGLVINTTLDDLIQHLPNPQERRKMILRQVAEKFQAQINLFAVLLSAKSEEAEDTSC